MQKKSSAEFGIAPLRSLDDFILEAARFQIPNVNDLEKWGNRVTSNLLYYQTNYFLMAILIFMLVGWVFLFNMLYTYCVLNYWSLVLVNSYCFIGKNILVYLFRETSKFRMNFIRIFPFTKKNYQNRKINME